MAVLASVMMGITIGFLNGGTQDLLIQVSCALPTVVLIEWWLKSGSQKYHVERINAIVGEVFDEAVPEV